MILLWRTTHYALECLWFGELWLLTLGCDDWPSVINESAVKAAICFNVSEQLQGGGGFSAWRCCTV